MSDEPTNPAPEGGAPPAPSASAAPAPSESYSHEDVLKILEADRSERAAAQPTTSAVERFRSRVSATPKAEAKPQPQQSNSELGELVGLMKMQLMHNLQASMPKPPPPPKAMTAAEKLATDDPSVWVRSSANAFTASDREALESDHRAKLQAEGFRGNIEHEAKLRAAKDVAIAGVRALRHIKLRPF